MTIYNICLCMNVNNVFLNLSTIHGPNYLVISAKARQEFLSAIQEAMNMEIVILQREEMLLNWQ